MHTTAHRQGYTTHPSIIPITYSALLQATVAAAGRMHTARRLEVKL